MLSTNSNVCFVDQPIYISCHFVPVMLSKSNDGLSMRHLISNVKILCSIVTKLTDANLDKAKNPYYMDFWHCHMTAIYNPEKKTISIEVF